MAFKVAALLAVLACAHAQVYKSYAASPYAAAHYAASPYAAAHYAASPYAAAHYAAAPYAVAHAPVAVANAADEYDPNPAYDFSYSVNDPLTGDSKGQSESRQGDNVQGSYSLVEADGTKRVVEYNADPINGFNAVVHKEGAVAAHAPVAVARAAPVFAAAKPYYQAAPVFAKPYYQAAKPYYHAAVASPAAVSSSFSSPYASYSL